jgi:hypothetical protein
MAKDHDFKRLVRDRMQDTGERYTEARAALIAQRDAGDRVLSDRTRSLLGQLADVGLAAASRDHLARLRPPRSAGFAGTGSRMIGVVSWSLTSWPGRNATAGAGS